MMGFFSRILENRSSSEQTLFEEIEARGGLEVVLEAWRSNKAAAEGYVSPTTSMQVAAVYACVRLLAETVASLPLIVYEEKGDEKRRAKDHYLYPLLHDKANPMMTAMELRETLQSHLALWGNAYAQLIYDERGRVIEIWPLRPDHVLEVRSDNGRKFFQYQVENGGTELMTDNEVWHIPGLGSNGVVGYSPIWLMRKSIGLAMDAEDFGSRFFVNDARPGIIVEHPGILSDNAYKNLKSSLEDDHQGVKNSHKPMILEEGMKLHEVGIPPEDAQYLETRQFQVREIARIFRVPPHLIGDLEQATFSNIEHQAIEFVVHSIRPWLVRWEQSIAANLMLPSDRTRFYAEHLVDGLLRGDTLARYQSYGYGRQWGWLSTNDIRKLENMNPVDGGDKYLTPLNYTDIEPDKTGQKKRSDGGNSKLDDQMSQAVTVMMEDVMARAVKREVQDLRAMAKKHLQAGNEAKFGEACREFYKEQTEYVGKQIGTMLKTLAAFTGEEPKNLEGINRDFCKKYEKNGLELLENKVTEAQKSGIDPLQAVESMLDNWLESRVDKIVSEESRQFLNWMKEI